MNKKTEKIEEYMKILREKVKGEEEDFFQRQFDILADSSQARLDSLTKIIRKL